MSLYHPSKKLTLPDIFVIALLLLAAGGSAYLSLSRAAGASCTISYADGTETYSLSASRTVTIVSNGHTLTVTIENGAVSVTDSDCPDRVCVNSGAISKVGQAVVCVPAQVILRIDGEPEDNIDAVAGGGM